MIKLYEYLQIVRWKITTANDDKEKFLFNTWLNIWQLEMAKKIIEKEPDTNMELKKKEVVTLMTKEVQKITQEQMESFNTPHAQQEEYLRHSEPELNRVNGMLFDMLVKNGIIR
jgi:hypothetical protein